MGEGFLRFAKPAMKHGLRKFWQRSTMTNLMRMKGLQVLVGAMNEDASNPMLDSDQDDEGAGTPKMEPGLYKCYKSTREIDELIRKCKKAISCLVVDDCLGVVCRNATGEVDFVPLNIGPHDLTKMGRHYFKFERNTEAGRIQEVGIMLPRIQLLEYEDEMFVRSSYTIVDRSHRHLNREGGLTGVINTAL